MRKSINLALGRINELRGKANGKNTWMREAEKAVTREGAHMMPHSADLSQSVVKK